MVFDIALGNDTPFKAVQTCLNSVDWDVMKSKETQREKGWYYDVDCDGLLSSNAGVASVSTEGSDLPMAGLSAIAPITSIEKLVEPELDDATDRMQGISLEGNGSGDMDIDDRNQVEEDNSGVGSHKISQSNSKDSSNKLPVVPTRTLSRLAKKDLGESSIVVTPRIPLLSSSVGKSNKGKASAGRPAKRKRSEQVVSSILEDMPPCLEIEDMEVTIPYLVIGHRIYLTPGMQIE